MVSHRCVVEDCPNSVTRTRLRNKGVKYYPFPKNEEMRKTWLVATLPFHRPEEYNPDHNSYICSHHFGPNDFQRDLKAELLNLKPKRLLKPEAIPKKEIRRSDADQSFDFDSSNSDNESQSEMRQTTSAETASNSISDFLKNVPGLDGRIDPIQPSTFVTELREKLYKRKHRIVQSSKMNQPITELWKKVDTREYKTLSAVQMRPAGVLTQNTRTTENENSSIFSRKDLVNESQKGIRKSKNNNLSCQNKRDPIKELWKGTHLSETQAPLVVDLTNSTMESQEEIRLAECQIPLIENVLCLAEEIEEVPSLKNEVPSVRNTLNTSTIAKLQNDIRKSLQKGPLILNTSKFVGQSSDEICMPKSQTSLIKNKTKSAGENKENVQFADPTEQLNGFFISYLGVPKVMILPGFDEEYDGNESQKPNRTSIISLEENFQSNLIPLVPNRTVFDLSELCRLCGSYSNRMKSIFDDEEGNFVHLIRYHFPGIKINEDDVLPVVICSRCELSLVSWNQFHKRCKVVNRRYTAILRKLKIEKSNDNFLNTVDGAKENCNIDQKVKMDVDDWHDSIEDLSADLSVEVVEIEPDINEYETNGEDRCANELERENVLLLGKLKNTDAKKSMIEDDSSIPRDCRTYDWVKNVVVKPLKDVKQDSPIKCSASKIVTRQKPIHKKKKVLSVRRMCHLCGNVFSFAESLRRHIQTVHSDEKPFKCNICQRRFNRRHNLTIHIRVVHERNKSAKKTEHLCDHCGKVLVTQQSLREHVSGMHTKIPLYECEKCHSTFYRKLTFIKHKASPDCSYQPGIRKRSRTNSRKIKNNFLKQCEICGLEFSKKYFYEQHALKHATEFTCSKCASVFTDYTALRSHEDSIHPELNPFECKLCFKRFKRQSLLNSHSITHQNERQFECDECAARFSKKKYLTTHVLRHTGERPFVCSICNKGFRQSGDMRKHKARHLKDMKRATY